MPGKPRNTPTEDDTQREERQEREENGTDPKSRPQVTPLDEDKNVEEGIEVNET